MHNFVVLMNYSLPIILFLFLASTVSAQFSASNDIDKILKKNSDETGPLSLILIINGKTVLRNHISHRGDVIRTDSKIRVASAAKWLAAATVLTVIDKGHIKLDDPVSKFLPLYTGEKGEITIRSLLSHTSGLPPNSIYIKSKEISLQQSVDSIALKCNLLASPGTMFGYGGVSLQVAARICEVATGKDWETIFRENLTEPCQMFSTDFGKNNYVNIGDGAYSTGEDYAKFLLMVLNKGIYKGTQVLSSTSVQEMLNDQIANTTVGYSPYRFKSVKQSKYYGLGVWIDRIMVLDSSATEISSQGAKGFTPWINTCKNLVGVISAYGDLSKLQPVIEKLKAVIDASIIDECDDVLTETKVKENSVFSLNQSYSDASSNTANFTFKIQNEAAVQLKLFDPLGNELKEMVNSPLSSGEYNIPVDLSNLKSGVYFYRLIVDDQSETKKFIIED